MMDGVSTMDTGSNRAIIDLNVESIAEVKVLVSNYQAEFGRSSGLQITAVTKSGTNRFRGSVYDVERNSDWNANSRTSTSSTATRRRCSRQREWGYSIGGPVGKPGGNNKLFFFYTQEFEPRTGRQRRRRATVCRPRSNGRATSRSRRTTTATRIRISRIRRSTGACTAANQSALLTPTAACSASIPASALYQSGSQHPEDVAAADPRQVPAAGRTTSR